MSAPREDSLVWIDLEMTGLDPLRCHILQIASVVTSGSLETLAEGPEIVVHLDPSGLETLSEWSRDQFGRSGLLERAQTAGVLLAEAEERTLEFLREWTLPRVAPLCGNSVHNDRAFLQRHMPRLHDHLHYRNVDVSSLKELMRRWYPKEVSPPPKAERHQALADIHESIAELKYYRERFFRPEGRLGGPPRPSR